MNKLRLIKICEIKGKIHPMEDYIISILKKTVMTNDKPYINFIKDDEVYLRYNVISENFGLDMRIWENFINIFNCNDDDCYFIFKYLFEKHLDFEINDIYSIFSSEPYLTSF